MLFVQYKMLKKKSAIIYCILLPNLSINLIFNSKLILVLVFLQLFWVLFVHVTRRRADGVLAPWPLGLYLRFKTRKTPGKVKCGRDRRRRESERIDGGGGRTSEWWQRWLHLSIIDSSDTALASTDQHRPWKPQVHVLAIPNAVAAILATIFEPHFYRETPSAEGICCISFTYILFRHEQETGGWSCRLFSRFLP